MSIEYNASASKQASKQRDSSIELLRIITMIVIIAHHYVVNSGLMELIETDPMSTKSLFLLIFGWGGKYGINCFVMITGYFMCTSNISLKKFLKLFLEVEIYRFVIYLIFLTTGYEGFSLKSLLKQILPIAHIGSGFVDSYLVFFLLIPFLNILIKGMTEKQHISLVMICVMVFSVLPSVSISVQIGYVGWFSIIYFIASYIRLYSKKIFENRTFWGMCTVCLILLSWLSVMACAWMNSKGMKISFFYFVNDCNKVLAVTTAVATFLFFKNLHLRYSKIINQMAAATFGVLLIHANSDTMRQWLWKDTLNNVGMYGSEMLVFHACFSVLAIYIVCMLLDVVRIHLLEGPVMRQMERMIDNIGLNNYSEKS